VKAELPIETLHNSTLKQPTVDDAHYESMVHDEQVGERMRASPHHSPTVLAAR